MKRWHHLFEADESFRRAQRDFASGNITQDEFTRIWNRSGRPEGSTLSEKALIFKLSGEKKRLLDTIDHNKQIGIRRALGIPDRNPGEDEYEGVYNGFHFRLGSPSVSISGPRGQERRTSTRLLQIQCPVCKNWYAAAKGKMGTHLKRKDHQGDFATQKSKPPTTRQLYRTVSSKSKGIKNLLPNAEAGHSGGLIIIYVTDEGIDKPKLDKWMEEKYNLIPSKSRFGDLNYSRRPGSPEIGFYYAIKRDK